MSLLNRYNGGDYYDYQVTNGGGFTCKLKAWHHRPKIAELSRI